MALAIAFAATPWLTRIYSPADFGLMALYVSVTSTVAIAATGRYELAILMPRRERTAATLVLLAAALVLVSAGMVSIGATLTLLLYPVTFDTPAHALIWIAAVPAGIVGLSFVQILTYWQNREKHFREIALSRAGQSLTMASTQVSLGYGAAGGLGLIAGHLIGTAVCVAQMLRSAAGTLGRVMKGLSTVRLKTVALRYIEFPKYLVVGHLANNLSSQMPVLLIMAFFGPREAGLYAIAERLTVIPTAVLMNTIGEVYRPAAAETYAALGNCRDIFVSTTIKLVALAAPISLAIWVIPPMAFPLLLGEEWSEAGEIASNLALLVFFQSLSSPLSQTLLLAGLHRQDLVWQIFRLISSSLAIAAAAYGGLGIRGAVIAHVAAFSVFYLIHSILQYKSSLGTRN